MFLLLKNGYSVKRQGNIIFVCGGNSAGDMRIRFRDYCCLERPEFEIFFPEYAIHDYFSDDVRGQFDIADFERLIASLSHAVVVFPEAAGSYAETGYFSAVQAIADKIVLALDIKYQAKDSFISLGPAKKIAAMTRFHGNIQSDYANPNFLDIVERIDRVELSKNRKKLELGKFADLDDYFIFCLIQHCFSLFSIGTMEDLLFIFDGLFQTHYSRKQVKQLTSILVGAGYLLKVGNFGHYCLNDNKGPLLNILEGRAKEEASIRLDIAVILANAEPDFISILEEARNVA